MFKGIIELESLNRTDILDDVNIIQKFEEHHPEATIKHWHGLKLEVNEAFIESVTEKISKSIKHDWYAIFWNENEVLVVFSNKIFRLSHTVVKSGNYDEIKSYGEKQGVQKEFINLQKEIDSW